MQIVYIYDMKVNKTKILKELERNNSNQSKLALQVGLTRQTISNFLNNKNVTIKTLLKVAKVLHYDPKDLLI